MLLRDIINHRGNSAFSSTQKAWTSPPPMIPITAELKRNSVSPFSCIYQNTKQLETFSSKIDDTVKNMKTLKPKFEWGTSI